MFVRQYRWKEQEGSRQQTQRRQKDTAILSSLLSVRVHNRQREEESVLIEMSLCVCVHNSGSTPDDTDPDYTVKKVVNMLPM